MCKESGSCQLASRISLKKGWRWGDKGRELIEVKYAWIVVAKKMREGYESVIRR